VHVSEADAAGFLQDVNIAGRHAYLADEPKAVGGADLGPTPYQYLSAGLGACTTMTIRMYARHKGYPLDHVAVDVYHDKRHVEAMSGDAGKGSKQDVFRRDIHVTGDLTDKQRADILKIADKCPVHKTLHATAVVETNLLD
jgi:putative redox protein